LAFEAGCEDYCEREVDELELQGGRVYLHLGSAATSRINSARARAARMAEGSVLTASSKASICNCSVSLSRCRRVHHRLPFWGPAWLA
jgi:hypothetical protein